MTDLIKIQYLNDIALQSIKDGNYLDSMTLLSQCLAIMKTEIILQRKNKKSNEEVEMEMNNDQQLEEYKCQIRRCRQQYKREEDHQSYYSQYHHQKQNLMMLEPLEIILTPIRSPKPIDRSLYHNSIEDGVVNRRCGCDESRLLFALLFNMAVTHQLLGSQTSSTSSSFSTHEEYLHNGLRLYELAYKSLQEISSSASSSCSSESNTNHECCSYMVLIMSNTAAIHTKLGNRCIAQQYYEQALSITMFVLVNYHEEQRQQQEEYEERLVQEKIILQELLDDVLPVLIRSSCFAAPAA